MFYFSNKSGVAFLMGLMLTLVMGCGLKAKKDESINHYAINDPEKFFMPESLLEISGITFRPGNSDSIYAIQDEQGRVFRLKWGVKKQINAKFGKQSDYEDVAILKDKVVILKSNGILFYFPLADAIYEEVDAVKEIKGLLPEGEYEGMYGDDATGKLYIICKNCKDDDSKTQVTGYVFQFGDSIYQQGSFHVNVEEIKDIAGKVKRGFRPSGLAKNPVTGEWFMISAVNKLLVVADENWKIKETCFLNSNIFNQPEGIAFDEKGNLYISNEGDDLSQGNILKFVRSK